MASSVVISNPVPPPPPKEELRILTQNCCLLPSYIYQSKGTDDREQRAALIMEMVQRYDVVLLQEVFGTKWCHEWRELFLHVPKMQSLFSVKHSLKLIDSGLAILSRYPIVTGQFIPFRSKSVSNAIINRGFLYAQIQVGEKMIHVVSSHLCPNEMNFGIHTPSEYRRRQLAEIVAFKQVQGHEQDPWVIGGDFNDDQVVFSLAPAMQITLADSKPPTSHRQVPYAISCTEEQKCIDYIATNRTQRYSRVVGNLISDHYGVETVITL